MFTLHIKVRRFIFASYEVFKFFGKIHLSLHKKCYANDCSYNGDKLLFTSKNDESHNTDAKSLS